MKKKIFAIAVIAICLSIMASATMAYYTTEGTAHNTISSGGVNVALEEWQQEGNSFVPYPTEAIKVMPATEVSKVVCLRNLQAESFVRASFEIVVKNAAGEEMDFDENILSITMGSEKWQPKSGDSYWYYSDALKENEVSEPFISSVVFDGPAMSNEYQGATLEVKIIAQAVQTAHNAASALDAQGWPSAAEE